MQGLCSLISHFKCVPFDTVYASKKPVAFWELYTWAKCARLRSPPARRDAGASGTSKFEGLSKILRTISTKTVGNNWCSNPWISKMCKPENTSSRDRIPLQPKRWNQQATRSIWRWQEMINKNRFNFIVKQILLLRLLEIPWGLKICWRCPNVGQQSHWNNDTQVALVMLLPVLRYLERDVKLAIGIPEIQGRFSRYPNVDKNSEQLRWVLDFLSEQGPRFEISRWRDPLGAWLATANMKCMENPPREIPCFVMWDLVIDQDTWESSIHGDDVNALWFQATGTVDVKEVTPQAKSGVVIWQEIIVLAILIERCFHLMFFSWSNKMTRSENLFFSHSLTSEVEKNNNRLMHLNQ